MPLRRVPKLDRDELEAWCAERPGSVIEINPDGGTAHLVDINGREIAWAAMAVRDA